MFYKLGLLCTIIVLSVQSANAKPPESNRCEDALTITFSSKVELENAKVKRVEFSNDESRAAILATTRDKRIQILILDTKTGGVLKNLTIEQEIDAENFNDQNTDDNPFIQFSEDNKSFYVFTGREIETQKDLAPDSLPFQILTYDTETGLRTKVIKLSLNTKDGSVTSVKFVRSNLLVLGRLSLKHNAKKGYFYQGSTTFWYTEKNNLMHVDGTHFGATVDFKKISKVTSYQSKSGKFAITITHSGKPLASKTSTYKQDPAFSPTIEITRKSDGPHVEAQESQSPLL